MTLTTTTNARQPSDRVRRTTIAGLVGAALVAAAGLVAGPGVLDDDFGSVATPSVHESTLDTTLLNGAIHVFTAPDLPAAVSPPLRLVVDDAASSACGTGHADACAFTHTWAGVNPLQGMGDIVGAAAPAAHESTLDTTLLNGAIHVFTAPDFPAVVSSPVRLVMDEAAWSACGSGFADVCHFTHTWAGVNPLQGMGDIVAGMVSGG